VPRAAGGGRKPAPLPAGGAALACGRQRGGAVFTSSRAAALWLLVPPVLFYCGRQGRSSKMPCSVGAAGQLMLRIFWQAVLLLPFCLLIYDCPPLSRAGFLLPASPDSKNQISRLHIGA